VTKQILALAAAAVTAMSAACKKVGDNEYQVVTPNVDVKADTHTVRTPSVEIVKDTAKVVTPNIDIKKDTSKVAVPKVRVKRP
jgi:hypothetical protein